MPVSLPSANAGFRLYMRCFLNPVPSRKKKLSCFEQFARLLGLGEIYAAREAKPKYGKAVKAIDYLVAGGEIVTIEYAHDDKPTSITFYRSRKDYSGFVSQVAEQGEA